MPKTVVASLTQDEAFDPPPGDGFGAGGFGAGGFGAGGFGAGGFGAGGFGAGGFGAGPGAGPGGPTWVQLSQVTGQFAFTVLPQLGFLHRLPYGPFFADVHGIWPPPDERPELGPSVHFAFFFHRPPKL